MESEKKDDMESNKENGDDINNIQEKEIKLANDKPTYVEPKQPDIDTINDNENKPITSSIFISKARVNDLEFIWKLKIKKSQFATSFSEFQSIKGRDCLDNYAGLIYIHYETLMCGSLIYVFQNGVTEEEFRAKMNRIAIHFKNIDDTKQLNHKRTVNSSNNGYEIENKTESDSSYRIPKNSQSPNHSSLAENNSQKSIKNRSRTLSIDGLRAHNYEENNYIQESVDKQYSNETNDNLNNNNSSHQDNNDTDANLSHEDCNPTYDLNLIITMIDFKNVSWSYKSIDSGILIVKELQLNTYCLMNFEEEVVVIIDTKRSKNYPKSNKFTGLVNEGMTCYMNSMIQSLNVLGYFKRGIFWMPFEGTNTVAYCLQRLFYELTFENESASTNKLVESFGWSRDLIFVQHDVQEFNMMLSDLMEKKMQGTKAEGSFKFLFEGKILNCIQCIDYDYTSKKEETFNDLQLNVKGCKNIYESLNKFTEEEILDNEDKYLVEGHGKEKAKKMLKFLSLPPVLILQLKRFEYNPKKEQMDKINDYFEFNSLLDMSDYVPENKRQDAKYALISILVHRGNVYGGHYYSFIRSTVENDDWYCFNDEIVRKADLYEVFDINYGGTYKLYRHREKGIISELNPCSDLSAYILIYIKVNQADTLLRPIVIEDIPQDIIKAIRYDKEQEKQEMILKERQEKYMDIYFISKETLLHYQGLGLARGNTRITLDPITFEDPNYSTSINFPKNMKVLDLYYTLISMFSCHFKDIDLFLFCMKNPNRISKRHEFSMRYITKKFLDIELCSLINEAKENSRIIKRVYLYIHIKKNNNIIPPLIYKQDSSLKDDMDYSLQLKNYNILFYVPSSNRYQFNIQEKSKDTDDSKQNSEYIVKENKKLLILKRFDFIQNTLNIFDVILIEDNNPVALASITPQLLIYYQNQFKELNADYSNNKEFGIVYFIESTNASYSSYQEGDSDIQLENNGVTTETPQNTDDLIHYNNRTINIQGNTFINIIYDFTKLFEKNVNNDSFIIIPYLYIKENDSCTLPLYDQIYHIFDNYKYKVIIPSSYSPTDSNLRFELIKNEFYLNESEDEIKSRLFSYISKRTFYELLNKEKETNNSFIYNIEGQLVPLEAYCQSLTIDNISLYSRINSTETADLPLLRYIGNFSKGAYKIEFDISTLPERYIYNYKEYKLKLFDIDSNPIADIDVHLQSEMVIISDILNHIYNPILRVFYPGNDYSLDQFQFLLFDSSKHYTVSQLEGEFNVDELNKSNITKLTYGVIPINQEVDKTRPISVAFQTTSNVIVCDPIIIYEKEDVLVSEAKSDIFDKIQRIKALGNNKTIDIHDVKKMKFYTYSINNFGLIKELLIINNKDNEKLFNLYKVSTYGLLVEFLPKINEKDITDYLKL